MEQIINNNFKIKKSTKIILYVISAYIILNAFCNIVITGNTNINSTLDLAIVLCINIILDSIMLWYYFYIAKLFKKFNKNIFVKVIRVVNIILGSIFILGLFLLILMVLIKGISQINNTGSSNLFGLILNVVNILLGVFNIYLVRNSKDYMKKNLTM